MTEWKCDQFDLGTMRHCRRNAVTTTPWGGACDKCARARAASALMWVDGSPTLEWAIREIVRQEVRRG